MHVLGLSNKKLRFTVFLHGMEAYTKLRHVKQDMSLKTSYKTCQTRNSLTRKYNELKRTEM